MITHEFTAFDGSCPDCGGRSWHRGPRGGSSVNIRCTGCGTWLNYFQWPADPGVDLAEVLVIMPPDKGMVMQAQRIKR